MATPATIVQAAEAPRRGTKAAAAARPDGAAFVVPTRLEPSAPAPLAAARPPSIPPPPVKSDSNAAVPQSQVIPLTPQPPVAEANSAALTPAAKPPVPVLPRQTATPSPALPADRPLAVAPAKPTAAPRVAQSHTAPAAPARPSSPQAVPANQLEADSQLPAPPVNPPPLPPAPLPPPTAPSVAAPPAGTSPTAVTADPVKLAAKPAAPPKRPVSEVIPQARSQNDDLPSALAVPTRHVVTNAHALPTDVASALPTQVAPAKATTGTVSPITHPAPTAAAQVAQALVGVSAANGVHRLTVQLAPVELGRVQISVARAGDGTAIVNVTAERAETLTLVQADSAQLHDALDKAGLASAGRSLNFVLADPPAQAAPPPSADPAALSFGSGQSASGGGGQPDAYRPAAPAHGPQASFIASTDPGVVQHTVPATGAIDITA